MKIIKYISIITVLATSLLWHPIVAQEYSTHEFSLYGSGGLSTLEHDLNIGKSKSKAGGTLGVGYTYFLCSKIGIVSGFEVGMYNSETKFGELKNSNTALDMDDTEFELRSTINQYVEKQTASLLQIPIMLQYQTVGTNKFYVSAGAKVGLPLTSKYKIKGGHYRFTGYYPLEELEYTEEHDFLGFGRHRVSKTKDDLKLKVAVILSAESGMKWKLGDSYSLYTGLYIDYGVNDINKNKGKDDLVGYNAASPKVFKNNSMLNSVYTTTDGKIENMGDKINLLSVGFKLKLSFGI